MKKCQNCILHKCLFSCKEVADILVMSKQVSEQVPFHLVISKKDSNEVPLIYLISRPVSSSVTKERTAFSENFFSPVAHEECPWMHMVLTWVPCRTDTSRAKHRHHGAQKIRIIVVQSTHIMELKRFVS